MSQMIGRPKAALIKMVALSGAPYMKVSKGGLAQSAFGLRLALLISIVGLAWLANAATDADESARKLGAATDADVACVERHSIGFFGCARFIDRKSIEEQSSDDSYGGASERFKALQYSFDKLGLFDDLQKLSAAPATSTYRWTKETYSNSIEAKLFDPKLVATLLASGTNSLLGDFRDLQKFVIGRRAAQAQAIADSKIDEAKGIASEIEAAERLENSAGAHIVTSIKAMGIQLSRAQYRALITSPSGQEEIRIIISATELAAMLKVVAAKMANLDAQSFGTDAASDELSKAQARSQWTGDVALLHKLFEVAIQAFIHRIDYEFIPKLNAMIGESQKVLANNGIAGAVSEGPAAEQGVKQAQMTSGQAQLQLKLQAFARRYIELLNLQVAHWTAQKAKVESNFRQVALNFTGTKLTQQLLETVSDAQDTNANLEQLSESISSLVPDNADGNAKLDLLALSQVEGQLLK
jgi:hypothetical protein